MWGSGFIGVLSLGPKAQACISRIWDFELRIRSGVQGLGLIG
jgi:hypothetical protein